MELDGFFKSFVHAFESVSTEYKRFDKFKKSGYFILPVEYTFGKEINFNINKKSEQIQYDTYRGQIIPMRQVLQKMFELENVFESTHNYVNELLKNTDVITNFVQGSLWKKKLKVW